MLLQLENEGVGTVVMIFTLGSLYTLHKSTVVFNKKNPFPT